MWNLKRRQLIVVRDNVGDLDQSRALAFHNSDSAAVEKLQSMQICTFSGRKKSPVDTITGTAQSQHGV